MPAAIDHVIVACRDPDAASAEIERSLGLRATGGGRHETHGTYNRLIWLGDSFIELVGVFDEAIAANSWFGSHIAGILSDRLAGFAGLAFASTDLVADVAALRAQSSPILGPDDGQRVRPDGRVVRWRVGRLPEADRALGLAFLIEHETASAEWSPSERETRAAAEHPIGTSGRLARVEIPVADVSRTRSRLLATLGLKFRPSLEGGGARDTSIGEQTLRLSRVLGGRPTIVIKAGRQTSYMPLLGCEFRLEPVAAG